MFKARLAHVKGQVDPYLPGPPALDRAAWVGLADDLKNEVVGSGEAALEEDWAALPATLYLDYTRNGNRVNFEAAYFARRRKLNALVLAECVESQDRFIDAITDGLWLLCEESGWQLPAHNSHIRGGPRQPLPDPERPVIDLFAAETGALLAVAVSLLEPALEKAAPGLVDRIDREIDRRIVRPYLTKHFWWMGNGDEPMNNWTVWCTQNVLWTTLAQSRDQQALHAIIIKAAGSIDDFLKDYGEDGACEEGALYYRHAALCLFNALETLSAVAPDAFTPLWHEAKIRNMADYILNAHIAGRHYFNFADCASVCAPCGARELLFGLRTGSEALAAFASADWAAGGDRIIRDEINLAYRLQALFSAKELAANAGTMPEKPDIFYPSIGLFIARDSRFALAVKAGDNGDSHNHNDTGSFIIYKNGLPLLIDIGVGSYTAKTFSPRRYEIWTMQSAYHNLPTFAGVMQQDGSAFAASDVVVSLGETEASISMDIAGAYPPEAHLRSYRRQVRLIKEDHIEIVDRFAGEKPAELSLMFAERPVLRESGLAIGTLAEITLEGGAAPTIEEIPIEDPRLRQSWPERLFRVLIPLAEPQLKLTIR
jgi:hypothetical protein